LFTVDGICTLGDVVIVDPTQVDLVLHATLFQGVVVTMATKKGFY
jgi:hypothetical protein